jgi:hypothetical protein
MMDYSSTPSAYLHPAHAQYQPNKKEVIFNLLPTWCLSTLAAHLHPANAQYKPNKKEIIFNLLWTLCSSTPSAYLHPAHAQYQPNKKRSYLTSRQPEDICLSLPLLCCRLLAFNPCRPDDGLFINTFRLPSFCACAVPV